MNRLFHLIGIVVLFIIAGCGQKEEEISVESIAISQPSAEMEVGETLSLKATVSPSNASYDGFTWTSTNPRVASVSELGLVTAISEGNTTITVMAGGKTASCSVTVNNPHVYVTSVTLDKNSISLYEGAIDELKATVTPDNADDPSLQWTSSDPDVVLVTADGANGKLFALAPGTADITVMTVDGGFTATCKVTVHEVRIVLKPSTLDICVGDEADIEVSLEQHLEGVSLNINWFSTNESIVSVDVNGHVKALSPGDAVILAEPDNGRTAFCKVHVRSKMNSVTITAAEGKNEINIGETLQLTATINPADIPNMETKWKSSDTAIATVSADGLVTAKSKGTVTISVTVKNGPETKTATYEIKVLQPVTSITVTPTTYEMFVDDVIEIGKELTIKVEPADADYSGFKYTTSTAGIISVSQGKITGAKAGTVTLTITPEKANPKNLKAQCKITVKAKVEGITIQGGNTKTIQVKSTLQLKATITPSNANQEVTWSSSDSKIATVDEKGLVTGVKAGTVKITATSKENSSIKATCTITVENIPVSSVELDKASLTLTEGDTYTLKATVKPDDAYEKTPTWSSSNTSVATVSDKGVVTAVKAGTATITAKCGGKTATCEVTVQAKAIAVTGVSLNTTSLTLTVGDKQTLKATVTPSNATNKSVTWSSSNSTIASVSSSGVVTAKNAGTAKITVKTKDGGKTATCTVTVQDAGPKGYKVFIKHGAEFKYDEIPYGGTSKGSAFTSPNTKYNYAGDNHELFVSTTSAEVSNMFNELGMTDRDFQINYDIENPVLMVKDANYSEPGDLPDEGKCDFYVDIYDLTFVYGMGLTISKLAPSNWEEISMDLALVLDPDVSIGGPHFVYVVYKALDNTKNVDAVIKFVYNVK